MGVGKREAHHAITKARLLHVQLERQRAEHRAVHVIGARHERSDGGQERIETIDEALLEVRVLGEAANCSAPVHVATCE